MMERTVEIPDGVEASIEGRRLTVKGPRGRLEKSFSDPRFNRSIDIAKSGNSLRISAALEKKKISAMAGTIAAHMRNMFRGVTEGYAYELKVVYTHFPITVTEKGGVIEVKNFLGEKGVRRVRVAGDCEVHVEKDTIRVEGANIEDVGQTAANIERACKLTRRDRRIFQDGIFLHSKKTQGGKEI